MVTPPRPACRAASNRQINAGQKLAAASFAAAGVVLFATGIMLLVPTQLALSNGMREGATLSHDLTTFALLALLVGHLWLAYTHPEARRALRHGNMDYRYATSEYPGWASEQRSHQKRAAAQRTESATALGPDPA